MYRLQYRNFGSHQTLVVNHTVDVNGGDRAGIRWYELRNTPDGWSIPQQGTYAPDANHRWMASIAMNGMGDIALGYSISSTSVDPSIRATGRFVGDALGEMTQGELEIWPGSGYQQHSSGRWGDYSMLAVDPRDDCTFWYTQEYYASVGTAPWQTRIASFKLRDCGPTNNPPSASIFNPADGSTVAGTVVTIQISASDTEDAAGTLTVEWSVDSGSWQSTTYNAIAGKYEANWDSTTAPEGAHTINARATDSGSKTATDSHTVTVDNVNDPPSMHVGDLDGSKTSQGNTWTASVTIMVHDASHNPVSGATVNGTWSNGTSGTAPCVTNASDGKCTVSKSGIPKRTGSVTFTVTGVSHATLTYNSAGNHDPDGDSNGTSITVTKP